MCEQLFCIVLTGQKEMTYNRFAKHWELKFCVAYYFVQHKMLIIIIIIITFELRRCFVPPENDFSLSKTLSSYNSIKTFDFSQVCSIPNQ